MKVMLYNAPWYIGSYVLIMFASTCTATHWIWHDVKRENMPIVYCLLVSMHFVLICSDHALGGVTGVASFITTDEQLQ